MSSFFPIDASTTGHQIDHLFWVAFILVSITFAIVLGLLIFFMVRYRSRPGHKPFYTHGNSRKALLLTLGLALLVFIVIDVNLALQDHKAWESIWNKPPDSTNAIRVQIMPRQFSWNIRYPGSDNQFNTDDDITTTNRLNVPVDRPVFVQLKSKDVIHSFFLPNFRIKLDSIPGMVTSLYFQAKKTGNFNIACAEHCGMAHYLMKGSLTVQTQDEFDAWLVEQAAAEDVEDTKWGWSWSEGSKNPALSLEVNKGHLGEIKS